MAVRECGDQVLGARRLARTSAGRSRARLFRKDSWRTRDYCPTLIATGDIAALLTGLLLVSGIPLAYAESYLALAVVLLITGELWRPRISLRVSEDLPSILGRLGVVLLAFGLAAHTGPALNALIARIPVLAFLVIAGRVLSYGMIRVARRKGRCSENTIIIGASRVGVEIATIALDHPEYGLRPIGFLDVVRPVRLPVPLLGDVNRLADVLQEFEVRRVIVAFPAIADSQMVSVIRDCGDARAEVHIVPRLFEMSGAACGRETDDLWGIPLVHLRRAALRSFAWRAKRVVDVVGASAALLMSAGVLALVGLSVKLTSSGPILFRQRRVGKDGRFVEVLKFRTMQVNDDADTTWSVANDTRQTSIGRILRKMCLDELPQLINVLRGEMSLVGPRPERSHFVMKFGTQIPHYHARHRVPVGMTGWAQIHGLRGDTSLEDRTRFDNQYIEEWSLWRDMVILARTFSAITGDLIEEINAILKARVVNRRRTGRSARLHTETTFWMPWAFSGVWSRQQPREAGPRTHMPSAPLSAESPGPLT